MKCAIVLLALSIDFASIVVSKTLRRSNNRSIWQVGGRAVAYYMATTVLAVILGIILVSAIHPGSPGKTDDEITKVKKMSWSFVSGPERFGDKVVN